MKYKCPYCKAIINQNDIGCNCHKCHKLLMSWLEVKNE